MRNFNLTAYGCVAFLFFLPGCGGDGHESGNGSETHSEDDGHDHEGEAHSEDDGHNHGADDEHDEHDGEVHDLGTATAAGSTLSVTVTGDAEPGSELHVELEPSGGADPAGLRLWVGLESAVGSLKAKANSHGEHFDAHVEVPASLAEGAKLWLQVEAASGETETTSLKLPSSHEE